MEGRRMAKASCLLVSAICSLFSVICHLIRHEFQERAVGIPEIDAGALPLGALALYRPKLDRHLMAGQMRDGVGDRTFPLEADVAVAGLDRQARHDHAAHAGSVEIELG